MTASTYARACQLSLVYEGGKVDNPKDPGGRTNQGVTQTTYTAWRKGRGLASRDVYLMEPDERDAIYRAGYADPIHYDDLPAGIDYATFDFSLNSGPARAAKGLQAIVGVGVDGVIGPITLAAVNEAARDDEEAVIRKLCEARLAFMQGLSTWSTFGTGWGRRVMGNRTGFQTDDIGVIDYATMMARGDTAYGSLPSAPAGGKAWPEELDPIQVRADLVAAAARITAIADKLPTAA